MVMFVLLVAQQSLKAGWKSVTITNGGLCVMTPGMQMMLTWYVGNLDMWHLVSVFLHIIYDKSVIMCLTYVM